MRSVVFRLAAVAALVGLLCFPQSSLGYSRPLNGVTANTILTATGTAINPGPIWAQVWATVQTCGGSCTVTLRTRIHVDEGTAAPWITGKAIANPALTDAVNLWYLPNLGEPQDLQIEVTGYTGTAALHTLMSNVRIVGSWS